MKNNETARSETVGSSHSTGRPAARSLAIHRYIIDAEAGFPSLRLSKGVASVGFVLFPILLVCFVRRMLGRLLGSLIRWSLACLLALFDCCSVASVCLFVGRSVARSVVRLLRRLLI